MTFARILAALLLLAPAFAPAQAPGPALAQGVTRGVSIEGVTEYALANGLRVLLIPTGRSIP